MTIIVLAPDLSRMELAILRRTLADAPDIDVRDRADDQSHDPDVILTSSMEEAKEPSVEAFLERWPRSRVLSLSWRGARASLVELRPCWEDLGELSLTEFEDVIRAAATRPRTGQR